MLLFFKRWGIYLAWSCSLLGSYFTYYYTEVINCECSLLWYQRTMLLPLVIILGMAAYKKDKKIISYALPLVFIGAVFAFLQGAGEWFYLKPVYDFFGCSGCEQRALIIDFIDFSMINFFLFAMMFFSFGRLIKKSTQLKWSISIKKRKNLDF
ncbi:MAG: hypothetical protein HZB76_03540 [Chlamydiae bacterium]|nr:hypothetical protein [Chlamydiota bacterium]